MLSAPPIPPRIPRPKEWRSNGPHNVTLCIGALCTEADGSNAIVFAADSRFESPWFSSEAGFKLAWAGGLPAMFAGSVSAARELLETFDRSLEFHLASHVTIEGQMRGPVHVHKRRLVDHHVHMKLGLSYAEFLASGRAQLSDAMFIRTEQEIAAIGLDCELIIGGFERRSDPADGVLIAVGADGTVQRHDDFVVIGSGAIPAQASLFFRQHSKAASLAVAVYHVYEAMKLAENAPGVGGLIHLVVIRRNPDDVEGFKVSTALDRKLLDDCFRRFGPKALTHHVEKIARGIFDMEMVAEVLEEHEAKLAKQPAGRTSKRSVRKSPKGDRKGQPPSRG